MSDYFEEDLIIDAVLEVLEHELIVIFSSNERKIFRDYLHNNPNASINDILNIVISAHKHKEAIKANKEQIANIERHCQNIKNLLVDARFLPWLERKATKEKDNGTIDPRRFGDAYLIIKEAEAKLLNKKIIDRELTSLEIKAALNYFRFHEAEVFTAADKANIALLGVINVRIPGGIKPVVLHSWGNLLNVPDLNSMQENPDGGPMIDRGNRLAVINAIRAGNLNKYFLQKLPEMISDIKSQNLSQKQMPTNELDNK